MENVLYVNKPEGITSFEVCRRLRKVLGTRKIGHTGTLDPLARGVMIILYNNACKANQFLVSDHKSYRATVKLGIETDTLDMDGNIISESEYTLPEWKTLETALKSFLGESKQEVPITSAVSVGGKRLYQYQRDNQEVALPVRTINISEIELEELTDDSFTFTTTVSSGTYIRALARDILKQLGLIGTISALCRLSVDNITIEKCDELSEIEKGNYHPHDVFDLLSSRYKMIDYPNEADILNGKKISLDCDDEMVFITHEGKSLAIYEKENGIYRSVRGLW